MAVVTEKKILSLSLAMVMIFFSMSFVFLDSFAQDTSYDSDSSSIEIKNNVVSTLNNYHTSAQNPDLDSVTLSGLNIPFVENQGQVDDNVDFYAQTFVGTVFVTSDGLTYSISKTNSDDTLTKETVLKENFVNSLPFESSGIKQSQTVVNYFVGEQKNWIADIPAFDSITLGMVWPNIEVQLKSYSKNIEKIFIVNPGADVRDIRLSFDGVTDLSQSDSGELILETTSGTQSMTAPIAYQYIDEKKVLVDVSYSIQGTTYGFDVSDYDSNYPLIIDPLIASTYLGGTAREGSSSIGSFAFDSSGNVIITGTTRSTDFPVTDSSTYSSQDDGYVAILNPSLTSILYATYFGGSGDDSPYEIVVDGSDRIFIAGTTLSSNFPITGSAYDQQYDFAEGFIMRFNPTLSSFVSTYLGASNQDHVLAITLDSQETSVYVSGWTTSSDFPTTGGVAQDTLAGVSSLSDGFISKLDTSLTTLEISTYVGGRLADTATNIVQNSVTGDLIISGSTASDDFPQTSGNVIPVFPRPSGSVSFVSSLNSNLSTILDSTYWGGSDGFTTINELVLTNTGTIVIGGHTESTDLPTSVGAYIENIPSTRSNFISTIPPSMNSFLKSTYLGPISDFGAGLSGLTIGPSNEIYVAGSSSNPSFPVTVGSYDTTHNGSNDVFISKLDFDLTTLQRSTFVGGGNNDSPNDLLVNSTGFVYVIGFTASNDFPTTPGTHDVNYNDYEHFVFVLDAELSDPIFNFIPVANDDLFSTQTLTPSRLQVLSNDTDEFFDPLDILSVTPPSNGTTSIIYNGTLQSTIDNPEPTIGARFGTDVGIDGNFAVIGTATGINSVYLHDVRFNTLLGILDNPTPEVGDDYGTSVAIDGDIVVVGAKGDNTGATDAGSAYLFDIQSGGPHQILTHTLNHPNPTVNDQFGESVDIDGNNVIIGARSQNGPGSAYLFDAITGNLILTFNHPDPDVDDQFGEAVAINGNNVIISDIADDSSANNGGIAYLFDITTCDADTSNGGASSDNICEAALHTFDNPTPASGDGFGSSVAIDANNVLISSGDDTLASATGAVYLFHAVTGNLLRTIDNPTPETIDFFGIGDNVAIDGNNILIGASGDNTGATSAGSAYLFDTVSGDLIKTINNPDPQTDDQFGFAVAIDGNTMVVGAEADDTGAGASGIAYAYNARSVALYTSDVGFTGMDSFDYVVTDGNGGVDTATANVSVSANTFPILYVMSDSSSTLFATSSSDGTDLIAGPPVEISGIPVLGSHGLTTNPINGELYGALETVNGLVLATISQTTGVATPIGFLSSPGLEFTGIEFSNSGQLFGITGNDSTEGFLHRINLSDASTVQVCEISNYSSDQAFAFSPNDKLFYHADGSVGSSGEFFSIDANICGTFPSGTIDIGGSGDVNGDNAFGMTYSHGVVPANPDFKIQHGTTTMLDSATSSTITSSSGIDFDVCIGDCFIIQTSTRQTGMGTTSGGGSQNAEDVGSYISNDSGLTSPGNVDFTRHGNSNDNRIAWQIVEYIGSPGGPNEMRVLDTGAVGFFPSSQVEFGNFVSTATQDDDDVAVLITGIANPDSSSNYESGLITTEWDGLSRMPVFTRDATGSDAVIISYAVIEFTGKNWNLQRITHQGSDIGSFQEETIEDVGNLSRAFILQAQQRNAEGINGTCETGERVYLSDTTTLNFSHEFGSTACTYDGNMEEVVWVLSNSDTVDGQEMIVEHSLPIDQLNSVGSEEENWQRGINPLTYELDETALFGFTSNSDGAGNAHPRGTIVGTLSGSSTVDFWQSDSGQEQGYSYSIVQWPRSSDSIFLMSSSNGELQTIDNDGILGDTGNVLATPTALTFSPTFPLVNDPPIANNDEIFMLENTHVTSFDVMANDFDADNDDLGIFDFTQPSVGSVSYDNNGTPNDGTDDFLTFTAPIPFDAGSQTSFTYRITDPIGVSLNPATVNINSLAIPTSTSFSDTVNLSNSINSVNSTDAFAFGNNVHVVWAETTNSMDFYGKTSLDNANTFKDAVKIFQSEYDIIYPHVIEESGIIHVGFVESTPFGDTVYYARSMDDGDSYSVPVPMGSNSQYADYDFDVVGSNLYFVVLDDSDVTQDLVLMRSNDSGATFAPSQTLEADVDFQQLFLTADDTFPQDLVLLAYNSFDGINYSSVLRTSDDNGSTFGLPIMMCNGLDAPPISTNCWIGDLDAKDGKAYLTFDEQTYDSGTFEFTTDLYLVSFEHDGITFSFESPIHLSLQSSPSDSSFGLISADTNSNGDVAYVLYLSTDRFSFNETLVLAECLRVFTPDPETLCSSHPVGNVLSYQYDLDSDGDNVYVIWIEEVGLNEYEVRFSKSLGDIHDLPEPISLTENSNPFHVIGLAGSFHGLWTDNITGDEEIFLRTALNPNEPQPKAHGDFAVTFESNFVDVTPKSNDTPVPSILFGPFISTVDTTSEFGATITDNLDGSYKYTPIPGRTGLDSFSYEIFTPEISSFSGTDIGEIHVNVIPDDLKGYDSKLIDISVGGNIVPTVPLTRGDSVVFNNLDVNLIQNLCLGDLSACGSPDIEIPPGGEYLHVLERSGVSVPFTVGGIQTDLNIETPPSGPNDALVLVDSTITFPSGLERGQDVTFINQDLSNAKGLCFGDLPSCPSADVMIPPGGAVIHTLERSGEVPFTVGTITTISTISQGTLPSNTINFDDEAMFGALTNLERGDVVFFNSLQFDGASTLCFDSITNCPTGSDITIPQGGSLEYTLTRVGEFVPFTVDNSYEKLVEIESKSGDIVIPIEEFGDIFFPSGLTRNDVVLFRNLNGFDQTICFDYATFCPGPNDILVTSGESVAHTLERAGTSIPFTVDGFTQSNAYIHFPSGPRDFDISRDDVITPTYTPTRGDPVRFNNFDTDDPVELCFSNSPCFTPDVTIPPGGEYVHILERAGPVVPFTAGQVQTDLNIQYPMSAHLDEPPVFILNNLDTSLEVGNIDVLSNDVNPLTTSLFVDQVTSTTNGGTVKIPIGAAGVRYTPTDLGLDTFAYIASPDESHPSYFDAALVEVRVMDFGFSTDEVNIGSSAYLTVTDPFAVGDGSLIIRIEAKNNPTRFLDVTLFEDFTNMPEGSGIFVSNPISFKNAADLEGLQTMITNGGELIVADYLGHKRTIQVNTVDVSSTGFIGFQDDVDNPIRWHEANAYYYNQGATIKVTDDTIVSTEDEVRVTIAIGDAGGRKTISKVLTATREGTTSTFSTSPQLIFSPVPVANPPDYVIVAPPELGNTISATYVGLATVSSNDDPPVSENPEKLEKEFKKYQKLLDSVENLEALIESTSQEIEELSQDDSKKAKKELKKLDKKLGKLEKKLDKDQNKLFKALDSVPKVESEIEKITQDIAELSNDDSKKVQKKLDKLNKKLDKLEIKLDSLSQLDSLLSVDDSSSPGSTPQYTISTGGGFVATATLLDDPNTVEPIGFTPDITIRESCDVHGGDKDGDAICNNWEDITYIHPDLGTNYDGLRVVTEAGLIYELPCVPAATYATDPSGATVCPDPDVKDLYVELDYMQLHNPSLTAINDVVDSFVNSNALGSDGTIQGIQLHAILDEQIPHETLVDWDGTGMSGAPTFASIKEDYFGTLAEKELSGIGTIQEQEQEVTDRLTAKRQAFLYGLFAHQIEGLTTSSGVAERPGNDFVIAMGAFPNNVVSIGQQSATIMHEIGHNLGLQHGGNVDVNCKPNYLSVMNYLYQFDDDDGGLVDRHTWNINRPLDFSRYPTGPILENRLYDNSQTLEGAIDGQQMILGGWDSSSNILPPRTILTGDVVSDWDGDGVPPSNVRQFINLRYFEDIPDCHDTSLQRLDPFVDWTSLSFNYRNSGGFDSGVVTIGLEDVSENPTEVVGVIDPETVKPQLELGPDVFQDKNFDFVPNFVLDDPYSASLDILIDWGDGTQDTFMDVDDATFVFPPHDYPNPPGNMYPVVVQVQNDVDGDGNPDGQATDTMIVTVIN